MIPAFKTEFEERRVGLHRTGGGSQYRLGIKPKKTYEILPDIWLYQQQKKEGIHRRKRREERRRKEIGLLWNWRKKRRTFYVGDSSLIISDSFMPYLGSLLRTFMPKEDGQVPGDLKDRANSKDWGLVPLPMVELLPSLNLSWSPDFVRSSAFFLFFFFGLAIFLERCSLISLVMRPTTSFSLSFLFSTRPQRKKPHIGSQKRKIMKEIPSVISEFQKHPHLLEILFLLCLFFLRSTP